MSSGGYKTPKVSGSGNKINNIPIEMLYNILDELDDKSLYNLCISNKNIKNKCFDGGEYENIVKNFGKINHLYDGYENILKNIVMANEYKLLSDAELILFLSSRIDDYDSALGSAIILSINKNKKECFKRLINLIRLSGEELESQIINIYDAVDDSQSVDMLNILIKKWGDIYNPQFIESYPVYDEPSFAKELIKKQDPFVITSVYFDADNSRNEFLYPYFIKSFIPLFSHFIESKKDDKESLKRIVKFLYKEGFGLRSEYNSDEWYKDNFENFKEKFILKN